MVLDPFTPTQRRQKEPPPPWWTPELSRATHKRSVLYKKKEHPKATQVEKEAYEQWDKYTKKLIKRQRNKSFRELGDALDDSPQPVALLARFKRNRAIRKAKNNTAVRRALDPRDFTEYFGTKFPVTADTPKVSPRHFDVDDFFRGEIRTAIERAPRQKATGADRVFAEVFRLAPLRMAYLIQELWAKCGELNYTPSAWRTTIIVPIHKAGNYGDAENYKPIALLSHVRKIIETALNMAIRRCIEFDILQFGFKTGSSCEQALLRYSATAREAHYTAILDLIHHRSPGKHSANKTGSSGRQPPLAHALQHGDGRPRLAHQSIKPRQRHYPSEHVC